MTGRLERLADLRVPGGDLGDQEDRMIAWHSTLDAYTLRQEVEVLLGRLAQPHARIEGDPLGVDARLARPRDRIACAGQDR